MSISNIVFVIILLSGAGFFIYNIRRLIRTIKIGRPVKPVTDRSTRLRNMLRLAIGQYKMTARPVSGALHILVYIGFILINIELLEIVLDGILGTHRLFAFLGVWYDILIGCFELLAVGVIVGVTIFWLRRNVLRIARFRTSEMTFWPKMDANIILYAELVLMSLFLLMNAADLTLQHQGVNQYIQAGWFPVGSQLMSWFESFDTSTIIVLERVFWWSHIIGILIFLNYLYYSKHLHILLAFPNTYYANTNPLGRLPLLPYVTREVKMTLGISDDTSETDINVPDKFGASDVTNLNRIQLMNAYACTECGRCTDQCPANQTGKKLSPRNIMMQVRDRLEDFTQSKGKDKQLLGDYITSEELWACTTCNACVEACPIGIDPLSIIMDMRQYLVMEQSAAPAELNTMMNNIENNGAPWPYNTMDRLQWNK